MDFTLAYTCLIFLSQNQSYVINRYADVWIVYWTGLKHTKIFASCTILLSTKLGFSAVHFTGRGVNLLITRNTCVLSVTVGNCYLVDKWFGFFYGISERIMFSLLFVPWTMVELVFSSLSGKIRERYFSLSLNHFEESGGARERSLSS